MRCLGVWVTAASVGPVAEADTRERRGVRRDLDLPSEGRLGPGAGRTQGMTLGLTRYEETESHTEEAGAHGQGR